MANYFFGHANEKSDKEKTSSERYKFKSTEQGNNKINKKNTYIIYMVYYQMNDP